MNHPRAAHGGDNTETNWPVTDIVPPSPPPEQGAKVYPDGPDGRLWIAVSQQGVESPVNAESRDRVLYGEELRRVTVRASNAGSYDRLVQVLAPTGQRRGEIAALGRAWISPEARAITLPKRTTKNGRDHNLS